MTECRSEAQGQLRISLAPPFEREIGRCWRVGLNTLPEAVKLAAMADDEAGPRRSTARVYEDGVPLGPPHALHATIRNAGSGAFSHWRDTLYFSTTDNSDPNLNGREYELRVENPDRQHRSDAHDKMGAQSQLRLSSLQCLRLSEQGEQIERWRAPAKLGSDVFVYRAKNVIYLPEFRFPICSAFVPEESINHRYHFERLDFGEAVLNLDQCERSHSEVCILGNVFSSVFGHWMEELLKVAVLESVGFDGLYVVPAGYPNFCFQSLHMLGVPDSRVAAVEKATVFAKAHFVSNISHMNAHRYPLVVKHLRNRLYDVAGEASAGAKRVWVERGATANPGRDVVNREEVLACIQRHGFERIDFGSLDFKRQVQIDRNAAVMAGPHGSAMVHCGFMKDRGHVIEAFSPNFVNPSVLGLCLALGHRYNQLVDANVYDKTYTYDNQVRIDLTHLELVLSRLDE